MHKYYKSLGFNKKDKAFTQKQLINNLYKKPIKDEGANVPHFNVLKPGYVQQMDLLYLPNDKGYKYLLVVVDCNSKKCDAEPLKERTAKAVLKGIKAIYSRDILSIPKKVEVDAGSEFRSEVKRYFQERGVFLRVALTGRHRQQAMVERANQSIQVPLFRHMVSKELVKGKTNREWVEVLPVVIKKLNKRAKPQKKLPDHPVAEGDSRKTLAIGTKVRVMLDNPIDMVDGKMLTGKFRSVDPRWEIKPTKVLNVLLMPGQPPMYLVEGENGKPRQASFTKNQLQVVPEGEQMPPKELIKEKKKKKKTPEVQVQVPRLLNENTRGVGKRVVKPTWRVRQ